MGADYINVCPNCESIEWEWDDLAYGFICHDCKHIFDELKQITVDYGDE